MILVPDKLKTKVQLPVATLLVITMMGLAPAELTMLSVKALGVGVVASLWGLPSAVGAGTGAGEGVTVLVALVLVESVVDELSD